jgi:hypothetical protein
MKTTLPVLSLLAASLLLAVPAFAQVTFGAIGDLSSQFNRSLLPEIPGRSYLQGPPISGAVPRHVTRVENLVVVRGDTRTNAAPAGGCTALALSLETQQCAVFQGRLCPGLTLLAGPRVTFATREDCQHPCGTFIASCASAAPVQLAAPPLCLALVP